MSLITEYGLILQPLLNLCEKKGMKKN